MHLRWIPSLCMKRSSRKKNAGALNGTASTHKAEARNLEYSTSSPSDESQPAIPTNKLSLINSHALAASTALQKPATESEKQHTEYLAKLEVPTLEQISSIAQVQEAKEREIARKYEEPAANPQDDDLTEQDGELGEAKREEAAGKIQRTYRGHRARREMAGLTLDPTTRWVEALKSARYQNITDPQKRRRSPGAFSGEGTPDARPGTAASSSSAAGNSKSIGARSNWHHVSNIASHAMGELPSEDTPKASMSPTRLNHLTQTGQREGTDPELAGDPTEKSGIKSGDSKKRKKKKMWAGKMMDLPYFLEMVDVKHRYGSNLRSYHAEWKRSNTHENFFYWLDYGEGKDVEIESVSRQRLEKEQVRYLSREERMAYLVHVDSEGRLIWAKNGERITTSTDYRDSLEGIVPNKSKAKMFREDEIKALEDEKNTDSETTEDGNEEDDESEDESDAKSSFSFSSATASPTSSLDVSDAERRYPEPPDNAKSNVKRKVKQVSAHAILNRLLRKTLSKNTWIFTADTSMNLYVGIKQSGSFQHSSFMRGSRVSAAGTIKIKDGQLRALNPLSGHYRPPARAFRHFVKHLRAEHVDMSRVSISKSYAVLVGLDVYLGGRKNAQKAERKVKHAATFVVHPAKTRREKEREKDHSRSAEIERERLRSEKGMLGRVLADARENVEQRWTALREPEDIVEEALPEPAQEELAEQLEKKGELKTPQVADQSGLPNDGKMNQSAVQPAPHPPSNPEASSDPSDPSVPVAKVPHQTGLDRKYKQDDETDKKEDMS